MKKIKIAHVITRMIIGGAQENTLLSVQGLKELPIYEVDLITGPAIGPEGNLLKYYQTNKINIIFINELRRNINIFYDIMSFFKLFKLIKQNKYEIIHTHSSKAGILCRLAAHFARCKVIIHTIHGLPFHKYQNPILNYFFIFLERFVARYTDKIITVCPVMTKKALAVRIGKHTQYMTIYSGINTNYFKNIPGNINSDLKRQLGIPEEAFVIGKVARLFHLKGHKYLLPAAARVIKKYPVAYFLLVGDGVLNDELKSQAKRLKIEKNIIFCGLQTPDKIYQYINIMDIVVHLSLREGLPRVVPQAFFLEKPVIVYDIDGAKDIVDDGINGYLIPPESIDLLSKKILFLIKNNDIRFKMGQRGKRKALDIFPHTIMISKLDNLYRQLYFSKDG